MDIEKKIVCLQNTAHRLRIKVIECTNLAKSGHPTSCASIAEILSVLFLEEMRYFPNKIRHPLNDRFVLSKGHAAPGLYAILSEVGAVTDSDVMTLRKLSSDFEGHPTPRLPFIDVATGSLGQGLSCAAGMSYVGKYIDRMPYRVYCLLGDGESSEGSVWEAMAFASHYRLDNLVAIIDVNRLGQSQAAPLGHHTEIYQKRLEAFGWHCIVVDGHDLRGLIEAFKAARKIDEKPVAIIAKTLKGRYFQCIEDSEGWHGKPVGDMSTDLLGYLKSLLDHNCPPFSLKPREPERNDCLDEHLIGNTWLPSRTEYMLGQKVATRMAYGTALALLGSAHNRVIGLDGDTKNSTFSIKLMDVKPKQYVECFIAEQNMCGIGIGMATRERVIPFCSTFSTFFSRAFDQIRMGAVSQTDCNFVGSHCGVSIGEDGPSQMGLEDLALFRSVQSSTVFYPSDAVSTEAAVELAANTRGVCYIRTSRPADPVIYDFKSKFEIGKSRTVCKSDKDHVTVVAAGVTLHEAIKSCKYLNSKGIYVTVIDPFTIKPLDIDTIYESVRQTKGRIVTVEDHYPQGGLGEAVACGLTQRLMTVKHVQLAVKSLPRSGKPAELLAKYEIDSDAINRAVERLLALDEPCS